MDSSGGYQPRQRRGAWPAIVCGNRRPDSRPLQSATIARPEEHLLNYPAGRGNWWRITESNRALPEASGLQPDGFAASLTLRKGAPGIQPDGLPIPRQEGQSWSSLVCWYCLRCQANRFYGPARSRRQRRPFDP